MSKQPNFLLVMADQLTPFMTGAYGNIQVHTPNLDSLCREGIRYDAAYSPNPLCTPARACFMTGRQSYELQCYDNAHSFSSEEPTFAHGMTLAGYETVLAGKMHFIGPDQLHGFAKRLTTDIYPSDLAWMPVFHDKERHIMQDPIGNAVNYVKGNTGAAEWSLFLNYDEETHFRAKEYLYDMDTENKQRTKPFCLCVSYHNPHDPFKVPAKYYDLYKDKDMDIPAQAEIAAAEQTTLDKWLADGFHRLDKFDAAQPENLLAVRRAYAALVTYIDDKLGELLDVLRHTGQLDNTVILFTSDHGDMLGERGMVQKRCFYEWSSRVPMVLRLPDGAFAGQTVQTPCSLLDVGATLLELADAERFTAPQTDGASLLKPLREPDFQRDVFSEYHGEGVQWPCFMIRRGDWKYTYIHQKECQLFNLADDPTERDNLVGNPLYQAVESDLREAILRRFSPDAVLAYLDESAAKRAIVRAANAISGVRWDFTPAFDGRKRYIREE